MRLIKIGLLFIYLSILTISIGQDKSSNIYFETDKFELSKKAKTQLDGIIKDSVNINKISIRGYADYRASIEHNHILSSNRANVVKDYLNPIKNKIILCEGKGELPSPSIDSINGVANHRMVEIIYDVLIDIKRIPIIKKPIIQVDTPITKKLFEIDTLEIGEILVLENLYFIGGRHFLRPKSEVTAAKLLKIMTDNPKLEIEIQGHICCKSNSQDGYDYDTKTYNLSVNRAKYIQDYLIKNGIHKKRLKHKGFARTRPLFPFERTPAEQDKNRRVEIKILKK